VRHADDGLLDTGPASVLYQIVEQGHETVAALEREALLTHILGMQIALQPFRSGQLPQNILLLIDGEPALHARHLEIILKPQTLIGVRYVGKLGADGVGVYVLQVRQNVLELGSFGDRGVAAAGEELGIEIGLGETEILEIEHIGLGAFLQAQWIQLGDQVAAIRVDLNETRDGALLGARPAGFRALSAAPNGRLLGPRQQPLADRRVRDFAGGTALQAGKVSGPSRIDPGRIPQELFVEVLNEPGISAGKRRGGQLVGE